MEAGTPWRGPGRASQAAAPRHAARSVPAHSVLPQALQVLLFPRLHRQERPRCRGLPDALVKEVELYSKLPIVGGRPLHYVYFGGGTPSYLSAAQLRTLTDRLQPLLPWDQAAEVTFECEPGTLQQHKLEALKEIGVTRLSLGVENFDDKILEANGRAHLSQEIYRSYDWVKRSAFDQINIDLIAGMVGETWDNWRSCVRKTIELAPDSVTIYQMELPFNTVFSKELRVAGQDEPADRRSPTGRPSGPGCDYAFDELAQAGYQSSSAYTMVKDKARCRFVYRDSLWHGADMFGTGVASFGHVAASTCRTSTPGSSTWRCSTAASCRWAGRCR